MLERNGKKETVREALSRVLGRGVGVRFDLTADSSPAVSRPASPLAPAAPQPLPDEPLIRIVLEELGGSIVRVEAT